MILCCDTINIVKKASRDLKVQRSLSRKRVATSRSSSRGGFSVQSNMGGTYNSFQYERNSVTKKAKVF